MNIFKRIISTAMTAILVAAAVIGASAEGSVLPDQNKNGSSSIVVHKYGVDASYQTTYEANGKIIADPDTVIGTKDDGNGGTSDVKLNDLSPLEGIQFKIERMAEKKNSDGNVIIPVEYEVDGDFTADTKPTDINGILTFGDLEFGVYKITEQPSAAVTQISSSFYVSVPMSDPSTPSEWIYDIHVYPKNEIGSPDIDKSVSYPGNQHDTADLTEQVKWIITSQIPADVAASKEYIINDDLFEILRYADSPNALEVSYIDSVTGQKVVLTEGSSEGYILTYTQGSDVYPWKDSLKIELTAAGRVQIANALSSDPSDSLPRLTVEFYTKFDVPDENIIDYLGVAIENQAKLKYTNSANVIYTPESEISEVHTGGVRLKKVDTDGNVLKGAEFKIYKNKDDALNGQNAIADPFDSSVDWIVTSEEGTGLAEFFGLAYGTKANATVKGDAYNDPNAETTYWIVEVTAPVDDNGKSYNLLKEPLRVVVNATSHDDTNIIYVVNTKFSLPITGGAGTLFLTIGGIVLVATGIFVLLVSKKKSKK